MTNLAYQMPQATDRVTHLDFAAHAAHKRAQKAKRALALQHRYGLCLLLLCALALTMGFCSAGTDLTALLVLLPLAFYLLLTRRVILYRP